MFAGWKLAPTIWCTASTTSLTVLALVSAVLACNSS